jgi:hypothetical protein
MNTYELATRLHDFLVKSRIVRMQTNGTEWWVEYADKYSGTWGRIR